MSIRSKKIFVHGLRISFAFISIQIPHQNICTLWQHKLSSHFASPLLTATRNTSGKDKDYW
jgi:hypothetical protein